jgi:Tfp pilus assembly protein PilO
MPERRRVKQTRSLEERMAEQAAKLKAMADQLPAGAEREALLKRVRIAETGAHLSDWLTSPGLRSPD